MKLIAWLPILTFVFSSFAFFKVIDHHHQVGNRAFDAVMDARSHTLIYDPTLIKVKDLPIRKGLHPRLRVKEKDDELYRDLASQGWSLGHKSDGSPMEPAAIYLRDLYKDVDQSAAELRTVALLSYLGYFALALANLLAIRIWARSRRQGSPSSSTVTRSDNHN